MDVSLGDKTSGWLVKSSEGCTSHHLKIEENIFLSSSACIEVIHKGAMCSALPFCKHAEHPLYEDDMLTCTPESSLV